jgi:hypothetical protein
MTEIGFFLLGVSVGLPIGVFIILHFVKKALK